MVCSHNVSTRVRACRLWLERHVHLGMIRACPFESGPMSRKEKTFSVSISLKLGISPT